LFQNNSNPNFDILSKDESNQTFNLIHQGAAEPSFDADINRSTPVLSSYQVMQDAAKIQASKNELFTEKATLSMYQS
jgi:hypothetical protein